MPIIPISCPSCGASLRVDSNKDAAICDYCGKPYIVKDAIVSNYINNVAYKNNYDMHWVGDSKSKDFEVHGGKLIKYNGSATDVVIPDNVKVIGEEVFKSLPITSVKIPSSVAEIGSYAFYKCKELVNVNISKGVKKIANWAFGECESITKIELPAGLEDIGPGAFGYCSSLTSVTIPSSVISIRGDAFKKCTSLTSVTIPSSVTSLEYSAFEGCSSLTSVTIPSSVISIGSDAFENCTSLRSVTLPQDFFDSGKTTELSTFEGCGALTEVKGLKFDDMVNHREFFNHTPIYDKLTSAYYRNEGLCQHCGGKFSGIFSLRCSWCGKNKDY